MSCHDEVVWHVINQGFCSFKAKTRTRTFCRNEYNLTGLCTRSSCPLANSRYATIIEKDGVCWLYMKTIERQFYPNRLWERVKLKNNLEQALAQIDQHLAYWPKFQVHRSKQRLMKIREYLVRSRRLSLKVRPKLERINKKVERREKKRERKAEIAAELDNAIKKQLLERLHEKQYEGVLNYPPAVYDKVLDDEEVEEEEEWEDEETEEFVADLDEWENEYEYEEDLEDNKFWTNIGHKNQVSDDEDDYEDDTTNATSSAMISRKRQRARVEVEYEEETPAQKMAHV